MHHVVDVIFWPSRREKAVMQLGLDRHAVARLTGLVFERVLEDMGYEYFAACDIVDFGPMYFHAHENVPGTVDVFADSACPTALAIAAIAVEFRISDAAIVWRNDDGG